MQTLALTADQTAVLIQNMTPIASVSLTDNTALSLFKTKRGTWALSAADSLLLTDSLYTLGWPAEEDSNYPLTDQAAIALLTRIAPGFSSADLLAPATDDQPLPDRASEMIDHIIPLVAHIDPVLTPIVASTLDSDWTRILSAVSSLGGAIATLQDRVSNSVAPIADPTSPIVKSVALPATAIQQDPTTGELAFYLLLRPTNPNDANDAILAAEELAALAVAGGYKRLPQTGMELEQLDTASMGELWVLWEMSPGAAQKFGVACEGRIRTL